MTLKAALINVFTICTIAILPHTGLIPGFAYPIPILLIVWLVLKSSNEGFNNIGFSFKRFKFDSILIGIPIAAIVLAFMQLIFFPILELLVSWDYNDQGMNDFITEDKWNYIFLVFTGCLNGGFYEEIVFHGFIYAIGEDDSRKVFYPFEFCDNCLDFRSVSYTIRHIGSYKCFPSGCSLSGIISIF